MKVFTGYYLPETVEQALALLGQHEGRARIVAGGTDLLVDLQGEQYEGHRPHFEALVDVTHLAGANAITTQDGWIVLGCAVSHTRILESPLVRVQATALAEACEVVGGPQVRNVATLVGNVAHALPAADGSIALRAFETEAQVAHLAGSGRVEMEWRPLASMYLGPGESAVDSTREVMTAVRLHPHRQGEASAFKRVMRPQGVALPILGMAARVRMHGTTIAEVALTVGPVAPVPFRAAQTEAFLQGKEYSDELARQAGEVLLQEARPRTSAHRATKEYRFELLPSLLEQVLRTAVERVQG